MGIYVNLQCRTGLKNGLLPIFERSKLRWGPQNAPASRRANAKNPGFFAFVPAILGWPRSGLRSVCLSSGIFETASSRVGKKGRPAPFSWSSSVYSRENARISRELPNRHKKPAAGFLCLFGGPSMARLAVLSSKVATNRGDFFPALLGAQSHANPQRFYQELHQR